VPALAGNIDAESGPQFRSTFGRVRSSTSMVDYEENEVQLAPALINRLLGVEAQPLWPRVSVAVHRYPIRGSLSMSFGGARFRSPQNLNYSFHRELMGLEEPRLRSASRTLSARSELSWTRVIDYSVSAALLRDQVKPMVERTSNCVALRLSNDAVRRAWAADGALPAAGLGNSPPQSRPSRGRSTLMSRCRALQCRIRRVVLSLMKLSMRNARTRIGRTAYIPCTQRRQT